MRFSALVLPVLSLTAPPAPTSAPTPAQKIAIDARGPVAFVEVTRTVAPEPAERGGGSEGIYDIALPEAAALVSVEVRDGGRWRSVAPTADGAARAAELYRAESAARGVTPASEPYDDSATHRVRVLRSAGHGAEPFTIRWRYAVLPEAAEGGLRLRFPAATERFPVPAEVVLQAGDVAEVGIAGVRVPVAARAAAVGRASTRGAWEVSWAPRESHAPGQSVGAPPLEARVATAAVSPGQSALAFQVRRPLGPQAPPPGSVLFLVDRSRSVGLPGLSAERDLVRALIETLPPSTRFDALFFDRGAKRLFPMGRPATREAIEAFELEMVPDRMQNGTDLPAALRDAGALLTREAQSFGPRTLLVLVTDGAIGDDADGAALDRALGTPPGLDVTVAALTVRAVDDEPAGARARDALCVFAAARGGVARELRASEIGDAVPAALADVARGGDLAAVRLVADGLERRLSESLAPGALVAGVVPVKGKGTSRPSRAVRIEAMVHGRRVSVSPSEPLTHVAADWLRPWTVPAANPTRLVSAPSLVAMVEPVARAGAGSGDAPVKGSMDRMVVRNVLSLAYMPRARACYLNRTAATPALRDLSGKVRLAIDLVRGEVERASIESSTLGNAAIERCLKDSAFEIEVPRAARSDAPVTAVLNMVFRPRTSDAKGEVDLGAVGDQIDLVIEEMHRREANGTAPPAR
jgi:hypothetical protein